MSWSWRNLFRRPGKPEPGEEPEMSEDEFQRLADAQERMVEHGNKMDNPVNPYDPLWNPQGQPQSESSQDS